MSDKEKSTHYHNRGQEDASIGRYDPPYPAPPVFEELISRTDQQIQDRKDYNEGWRHTKDQKK